MTPLARLQAARIAAQGPMTVADWMADCLMHPAHGYYATRDPFGSAGDFTTAPEISQMFGELVGLALVQAWLDQGAPAAVTLAELGPGRGTLMADALRAARVVPGFHDAARVVLVETSPHLRRMQADRVPGAVWADGAADLPDAPLFLIANEFFDALPIRQFERRPTGWHERVVGLAGGALTFGLSPAVPCPDLRFAADPPGTVVETCPAAAPIMAEVAGRIARHGGAALVIDYGGWRSCGDTLQALRQHESEHPLASPGLADLTAHVDFEPLALAARAAGAAVSALVPQGAFLQALGIAARADRLAARLDGAARASHAAALHRLTDPAQMGTLFKVLGVRPAGAPPIAGLNG